MWCDHPGIKAVTFLVHHVNRASQLWAASNRATPPPKVMAASRTGLSATVLDNRQNNLEDALLVLR
jgi:hypothetical protein